MTGEWQPPEGSEVAQPPRDNPITGHVIQRLFNMVSPPTVSNSYSLLNTVNQLLFAMNLFRDLLEIIWFAVTYVRVQALILHHYCYHSHTAIMNGKYLWWQGFYESWKKLVYNTPVVYKYICTSNSNFSWFSILLISNADFKHRKHQNPF